MFSSSQRRAHCCLHCNGFVCAVPLKQARLRGFAWSTTARSSRRPRRARWGRGRCAALRDNCAKRRRRRPASAQAQCSAAPEVRRPSLLFGGRTRSCTRCVHLVACASSRGRPLRAVVFLRALGKQRTRPPAATCACTASANASRRGLSRRGAIARVL